MCAELFVSLFSRKTCGKPWWPPKFPSMDKETRQKLENAIRTVRKLADQLEGLLPPSADEVIHVPPEIAALVAERYANRICLGCLQPLLPGERDKRGNHSSCYNTFRVRIRKGDMTEKELIEQGKMLAENKKPGRPAKVDQADESARLAQLEARNEATQKRADGKRRRKPKAGEG